MNLCREFYRRLFVAAVVCLIGGAPSAFAQDDPFCSASEVSDALDQLACVADGAYLSPESGADAAADRCGDAPTEGACRSCFRKVRAKLQVALRQLIRLDMVERAIMPRLKASLAQSADDICSDIGVEPPFDDGGGPPPNSEDPGFTPDPWPTPPAADGFGYGNPFGNFRGRHRDRD